MMSWESLVATFHSDAPLERRSEIACEMALQFPQQTWPLLTEAAFTEPLDLTLPAIRLYPSRKAGALLQRLFLERGGQPSEQMQILKTLAQIPAVSALLEIAEDPYTSPPMQDHCSSLLLQFPTPDTQRFFTKELSSHRLPRRYRAIQAVGEWGMEQAVVPLSRMLNKQVQTPLFLPIVSALGMIPTRSSIRELRRFLLEQTPDVQLQCAEVLAQIPRLELGEPLEDCLSFLEGQDFTQMEQYLAFHQEIVIQKRDSELQSMRDAWEEQLFEGLG